MASLLMTVEDRFDIPAFGGLVVTPGPLAGQYDGPLELSVTLKRPDGTRATAPLRIQHVFSTPPPKEPRWACILSGVARDDVPIGTELWFEG